MHTNKSKLFSAFCTVKYPPASLIVGFEVKDILQIRIVLGFFSNNYTK